MHAQPTRTAPARQAWRQHLTASAAVLLTAVPLSLGIALACGAPLWAGLVAAAVGGLVAGGLGGAPLRASGAAAGLTVVTAELVQRYGWRATCAITVLAGATQLALGAARMARTPWVTRAVTENGPPIARGMLAGIGATIAVSRLHVVLGGRPGDSALEDLAAVPSQLIHPNVPVLVVGAATVAVLLAWPRLPVPVARWVRPVPAPFAAVAVACAVGLAVGAPRVSFTPWELQPVPTLPHGPVAEVLAAVATITLVASVETAAMPARALAAQGAANMASGLLGGLPVAGGTNDRWRPDRPLPEGDAAAEGGSPLPAVLYGTGALLCAALFMAAFTVVPAAALAALVMAVGVEMVRHAHRARPQGQGELVVYAATLGAVVLFGVLEGVTVGISITAFLELRKRWSGLRGRYAQAVTEAVGTHRCLPWTPWRDHHCTRPTETTQDDAAAGGSGRQLLGGVSAFQRNTAPLVRDELARLAREGQRPSQLFLTCADSRLVTSMITSSGPGDLFTVRNVGNLMPPPGSDSSCDSVGAAVEYAVDVLKVGSITVCGHSGCGAMQALLDLAASPAGHGLTAGEQTPLTRWLRHGRPSLARMQRIGRLGRGEVALAERLVTDDVERLALVNVVQQLDNLMAHACVARRVAEGSLQLQGMYFHVGEAQAYVLDRRSRTFSAVRPEVLDAV
ncbi:carbonic anhydrase [Streptomyces sp. NPDC053048]|uniref:carbonic anhydrase n=1 Tax=Streptomyces sp. NPDC053048 TaxID=3365694 RepID=UPI0037CF0333